MQSFRPFRATVHRHQKYYSEKRSSGQNKGSVFNLPRQIISQKIVNIINPEIPKLTSDPQHKIATDYQSNLKKSVKKHSIQNINRKTLQKIAYSFIQIDQGNKSSVQKIARNKSSQLYPNKNMAFKTLNILYRTIIETKVRRKQKETFELSAKKLPILQKGIIQPTTKKISQMFGRNSSFDKYKLNLTTINNESLKNGMQKYGNLQNKLQKSIQGYQLDIDNDKSHIWSRRRRFERQQIQRQFGQIVPWNQAQEVDQQGVGLYE